MADKQWCFDNPEEAAELINGLTAQVEQLREVIDHYKQGLVPSDNAMDELVARFGATPVQCLTVIKAQAAKDAIVSALRLYGEPTMSVIEIDNLSDKYANQIRKQAKGE